MRNIDPTFGDLTELRATMLRWANKLTRRGSHAEDIVQSALLRMLANRHRFDPAAGGVQQWAWMVLLNVFRAERARSARVSTVNVDDLVLVAPENPERQTYARQVFAMLGLDAAMLLAEPASPLTPTQRVQRHRTRARLAERAAA